MKSRGYTNRISIEEGIREYEPLVRRIASMIYRRLPGNVSLDDLVQEGMLGLIDALHKHEQTRSDSFQSYAAMRIRGSIYDSCRRNDTLPRYQRDRADLISAAITNVEQTLGRPASEREVAEACGMTLEQYHSTLNTAATLTPLDAIPESSLVDAADEDGDVLLGTRSRNKIRMAVEHLPEKQRLILSLHYERYMSYREIAAAMDLTPGRIAQLHSEAMIRIRAQLKDQT